MSKIRVNELETLDGLNIKDVASLIDDINTAQVTTSTGEQALAEALDGRVFYVDSITSLLGVDLSTIQPGQLKWIGEEELVIYVDISSGDDANDGFESSSPKQTLQSAIDRLEVFGPYLNGQFVIQLAAGTYARGRFPDDGLPSENPIIIRGPDVGGHPNVPTAIISEGSSNVSVELIRFRIDTQLLVRDVHVIGANGSTSSAGIMGGDGCRLYTENVHATDCYWGVGVTSRSNLDVKGGVFTRCGTLNGNPSSGAGTRTLFNCRHAIGYQFAADVTQGPWFFDCDAACFAQEGSTGHADNLRIEDCRRGLIANVNSRFNYGGTEFKRNGVDVSVESSHVFGAGAVYGEGADESSSRVTTRNGGVTRGVPLLANKEVGNSLTGRLYAIDRLDQVVNTTSGTVFHTSTLGAGMFRNNPTSIYPGGMIRLKVLGSLSGTAAEKRITLRLAGTNVGQVVFAGSDTGSFYVNANVYFNGKGSQFCEIEGSRHLGNHRRGSSTRTFPLTLDEDLNLEAEVANTSDSITVNIVEAEIFS